MFQKIKWHLTIINGLVVGLILIVISFLLYFAMSSTINTQIKERMEEHSIQVKQSIVKNKLGKGAGYPFDPRSVTIMWLDGNRVTTFPEKQIFIENIDQLAKLDNGYADLNVGDYKYRVLTESFSFADVHHVQVIWNVTSETDQLLLLKKVLIYGTIIGVILSVLIGRFLTQHALVPIRKSWEQQERFVGDASHELRTPLAVIQNQAESLLQNPEESIYEHSDEISKILKESKKMKRLISDLLLLAKSDSNELILHKRTFPTSELLEDISQYFQDIAELHDVDFSVHSTYDGEIEGDLEKIQQVLIILLDNAFKYRSDSSVISLQCKSVNNKIVFTVEDNGIGIAKEHVPLIFDRFYRVEKSRNRKSEGGYGLGLSIAKWIVDAHNGNIDVESEAGKGTKFIVSIPNKKNHKSA